MKRAALLALAAVTAVGCGGGDDSKGFREDYNAVVRQYSTLPVEIGTAVQGASTKTDKQLESEFAGLADRLSGQVTKLRKLDPPGDAEGEYKIFVNGLAKVDTDLRGISTGAKAHSSKKTTAAAEALVRDSKRVTRYEDALKKAVD